MKAAATALAVALATASVSAVAPNPTEVLLSKYTGSSGLHQAAAALGKYMGTATELIARPSRQSDTHTYAELSNTKDWGMLTSGNLMRPSSLQATQGTFVYTNPELFVTAAKNMGVKLRCQALVSQQFNPSWLSDGTWTNDTLLTALGAHITDVMKHFGDDCAAWDVVNDAIADSGNGYRTSFWYNTSGPSYIAHAFNVANQVKTSLGLKTKLYYNDDGIQWMDSAKTKFALDMIKDLLAKGVKIDGVGMEGHFTLDGTPTKTDLMRSMQAFTDLGVEVAITQMEIRCVMPPTMAQQKQQAIAFASVVSACAETPMCVGVTLWDFLDSYSWVPGSIPTQGWALPWFQPNGSNTPIVRKGSYDAMLDAWSTPSYMHLIKTNYTGDSGLNDRANVSGKFMGTGTDVYCDSAKAADPMYMAELNNSKDWGSLTPMHVMTPAMLQPTKGNFTFEEADKFIEVAMESSARIHCHALLSEKHSPSWLTSGSWTNATLLTALGDHIAEVMEYFAEDCDVWDVLDEAIGERGGYAPTFWYNTSGEDYIANAFDVANDIREQLDLTVKLYYNDHHILAPGTDKTAFAQNMIKNLVKQGVTIDGVGLGAHFKAGETPSKAALMSVMKFYTDLGLEVEITELDIVIDGPETRMGMPPSPEAQQQQASDVARVIRACKETPKCVGVTLRDFVDTYTPLTKEHPVPGWGLPFFQPNGTKTPLVRKALYEVILDAWVTAEPPTPAPTRPSDKTTFDVLKSLYTGAAGLNDAANTTGRYMGTATGAYMSMKNDKVMDYDEETYEHKIDLAYMTELLNHKDWSMITPVDVMRPSVFHPEKGNFSHAVADAMVNLTKTLGIKMRCPALVDHRRNPAWLVDGTWTNETLLAELTDHITKAMTHFGDACYSWDVVHDAIAEGGGYRPSFWYNASREAYIAHAFNVANQVKTNLSLNVKLYYSDHAIEFADAPKTTFAQGMIKGLLDKGVKIDGMGVQGHFEVGATPSREALAAILKVYADLGLDVAITELDIRTAMPPSTATQQQQATDYGNVIGACRDTAKCVGVTVWDFVDTYSWIPSAFPGQGWATPFYQPDGTNTTVVRKRSYDSMIASWDPTTATTDPPTTTTTTATPTTAAPTTPASTTAAPSGGITTWGQCHVLEWLGTGVVGAFFLLA